MDQSQMLAMLTNIYEKLVADVAARVIATEAARPGIVSDAEIAEMRVVAIAVFEEMIEPALESYDPSDAIEEALDNRDLESEIGAAVETAVGDLDIEEAVRKAFRNVEFTVSVA
jgi:hypothetical protein